MTAHCPLASCLGSVPLCRWHFLRSSPPPSSSCLPLLHHLTGCLDRRRPTAALPPSTHTHATNLPTYPPLHLHCTHLSHLTAPSTRESQPTTTRRPISPSHLLPPLPLPSPPRHSALPSPSHPFRRLTCTEASFTACIHLPACLPAPQSWLPSSSSPVSYLPPLSPHHLQPLFSPTSQRERHSQCFVCLPPFPPSLPLPIPLMVRQR
ncbi:hypothetical protein IWX90DRAFT_50806 [Phyllosticta citrichinensis]|uniref:Uncharacterized protein n=1 Tax=Phyllosticta citrichinensis TaxID=1130410 RepID=A0ABR1XIN0_9PEZI